MAKNKFKKDSKSQKDQAKQKPDEAVDDTTAEDTSVEVKVESSEPELTETQQLQLKVDELDDKLMRSAAEFDNYKKRNARQFDMMVLSAKEQILSEVLDIYDNFDRALSHEVDDKDLKAYTDGIQLIFNQMKNLLTKNEIEPINAIGQPFDPNFHEALMQINSDDYKEGTVAMEVSKGYKMKDRVVRHSKVGVSSGPVTKENNQKENDN